MRLSQVGLVAMTALWPSVILAASDEKTAKPKAKPCTIHSPNTGSYFDISPISLVPPKAGSKVQKDQRTDSWHAKGYDYPANFTLNVCAPVLEEVKDVVGVSKSHWANVSAYYELGGKTYSIGYVAVMHQSLAHLTSAQRAVGRARVSRKEAGAQLHEWLAVSVVRLEEEESTQHCHQGRSRGRQDPTEVNTDLSPVRTRSAGRGRRRVLCRGQPGRVCVLLRASLAGCLWGSQRCGAVSGSRKRLWRHVRLPGCAAAAG